MSGIYLALSKWQTLLLGSLIIRDTGMHNESNTLCLPRKFSPTYDGA